MNVTSFTLCVEANYCSEKHDTPAGTARVENPFLWRPPQKLVGAVLAKKGAQGTEINVFYII
ncbi:hypothetical protein [Lysinibacillus sp. C5.1]|uniref:hypothetical protein n=1 Tax=Lysinibacillus sp. C5.1 TaxID=2796169 RepID=UPI003081CF27